MLKVKNGEGVCMYVYNLNLFPFSIIKAFKYRDRVTIICDILKSVKVKREAKRTQIMENARLNYVQTKKYLSYLLNSGYLAITERQTYVLTEKGSKFLYLIEIQKTQIVR
jgi:predicted transcriptional regulator